MADAGFLELQDGAEPASPPASFVRVYVDENDGHVKRKNESGVVVDLESTSAPVSSVFGRTGVVVQVAGDYTASQVTNVPAGGISALTVQAAVAELDADKVDISHIGSGGAQHALATGVDAGFLSSSDFTKLAAIPALVQPLDSTLTALAAYNTNGFIVQTALDTFTGRSLSEGNGINISNPDGILAAPAISVDETDVNHDNLLNFVANEHVDHSSVQIATAATSGLQGGGDLTATRNLSININGMTAHTGNLLEADELSLYDSSAAAHRKISLKELLAQRSRFRDQASIMSDDFVGTITGGLTTAVVSGTGASSQAGTYGLDAVEKCQGVTQIDTGTTAAGRATLASVLSSLVFGTSRMRVGVRAAMEALSTVGETFTLWIGFIDNSGAGDHTDGAYFRYTDAVNGGKWEAVTSKNSVRTATDTGIAAGINYSVFEVECSEDNANVYFYIDGVLVATNTTNIPTAAAGDLFGIGIKIQKSVGIVQRNASIDWYYLESERSAAR